MVNFNVSCKFYSDPRVIALGRARSIATDLWLRVGTYCANHYTDGLISVPQIALLMPDHRMRKRALDALEKAGLMTRINDRFASRMPTFYQHSGWPIDNPTVDKLSRMKTLKMLQNARARQSTKKRVPTQVGPRAALGVALEQHALDLDIQNGSSEGRSLASETTSNDVPLSDSEWHEVLALRDRVGKKSKQGS